MGVKVHLYKNEMKNGIPCYNGIDLFKIIGSIAVIAIHTLNKNIFILKWAVPFFFLSTGFLLYRENENKEGEELRLRKSIYHFIRLYLVWTLVYSPLAFYKYIFIDKLSIVRSIYCFFRDLIFMGEHYNSWMLWYLLAVIYGLCIILFFVKCGFSLGEIVIAGLFIRWIGAIIDWITLNTFDTSALNCMGEIIDETIKTGRLFSGVFFIALGGGLRKIKLRNWVGIFFIAFGVLFERIGIYPDLIMTITSVGILIFSSTLKFKDSVIFPFMRTMSTVIYFIHLWVWTIYYKIMFGEITYGMQCFVTVMIVSLFVSFMYTFFIFYVYKKRT